MFKTLSLTSESTKTHKKANIIQCIGCNKRGIEFMVVGRSP